MKFEATDKGCFKKLATADKYSQKDQDCNYSQILRPPISPVNHLLPSANRTVWWQLAFYIEDGEVWGVISSVALGTL